MLAHKLLEKLYDYLPLK